MADERMNNTVCKGCGRTLSADEQGAEYCSSCMIERAEEYVTEAPARPQIKRERKSRAWLVVQLTIIVIGVLFDIFGCIGLVRLPDVYNRLQASTKCVTVGTCFILIGSLILLDSAPGTVKGIICIAFVLITSPTAAHALARAAHRSGIKQWERSVVDHYEEDMHALSQTEEEK